MFWGGLNVSRAARPTSVGCCCCCCGKGWVWLTWLSATLWVPRVAALGSHVAMGVEGAGSPILSMAAAT